MRWRPRAPAPKSRPIWKSAFAALAGLVLAGQARAEPAVWVVKDRDSEMVLFGSVHVLPPGLAWQPRILQRALKAADDIWFELPTGEAVERETSRLAAASGILPPGQSLYRLLGREDAARLSRVAAAYKVAPPVLDRLQPWLAEVALAGAAYRRAGASAADGVEAVLSAATPAKIRRRAFETPAQQLAYFSGVPMADQIASLGETLKEMEERPDDFAILIRAWTDGDLAALDREALAPLRRVSPLLFQRLVVDRNVRWTETLDARLKGRGRTVVVVGVGHLIGPDGLPARLRALGYSVQGP
ncbi:TraB/GumN family protein [Phenylobacterium sp.]|uniref:TraB/GumN family protein n=1 Tax=Phenylobacterium sp. TaxID=1871053 RepID=UPI00398382DC